MGARGEVMLTWSLLCRLSMPKKEKKRYYFIVYSKLSCKLQEFFRLQSVTNGDQPLTSKKKKIRVRNDIMNTVHSG